MVKKKKNASSTLKSAKIVRANADWTFVDSGATLTTITDGVEVLVGKDPSVDLFEPREIKALRPYFGKITLGSFAYFRCKNSNAFVYVGANTFDTIGSFLSTQNITAGDSVNPLEKNIDGVNVYKGINFVEPTESQDVATRNYVDVGLVTNPNDNSISVPKEFIIQFRTLNINVNIASGSILQLVPYIASSNIVLDNWNLSSDFNIINDVLFFKPIPAVISYFVDVRITGDFAGSAGALQIGRVNLRKVSDGLLVQSADFSKENQASADLANVVLSTYTGGLSDSFITSGVNLELENSSGQDFTLQNLEFVVKGTFSSWSN